MTCELTWSKSQSCLFAFAFLALGPWLVLLQSCDRVTVLSPTEPSGPFSANRLQLAPRPSTPRYNPVHSSVHSSIHSGRTLKSTCSKLQTRVELVRLFCPSGKRQRPKTGWLEEAVLFFVPVLVAFVWAALGVGSLARDTGLCAEQSI